MAISTWKWNYTVSGIWFHKYTCEFPARTPEDSLPASARGSRPEGLHMPDKPYAIPFRIIRMPENSDYTPPAITVRLEPEGKEFTLPRPKTVLQLLRTLGIRRGAALVIREGGLLTQDRAILPGDRITVRLVTSSG